MCSSYLVQCESEPPRSLHRRRTASRTSRCLVPPVDLIEPGRERRADQQIVVPPTRRHTPPQRLPRSWPHFVGAGRDLMAIYPRDVGPVVGVLLEAATV